ncbi:IS3 family transposase [Aggregatibacter actinomycetemcomitans]|uniref:IS3 family transposase n=1 Tax=Aggregatibacter actinomycetemcomitans TaxID=714 RepID=UPI00197C3D9D|nr:IS3 family transposase [Aggregatibacter actinomycetemcomitans]MBN6081705.1 IS3 family transposase [Aggregatibacter actinomycetemcomitans]MBN6084102.1 IS3 family transposase [Aggregatibacter actinomycetemcomitans]
MARVSHDSRRDIYQWQNSACFYSQQFKDVDKLKRMRHDTLHYYNEERIKPNLNNLSPAQYSSQYLT